MDLCVASVYSSTRWNDVCLQHWYNSFSTEWFTLLHFYEWLYHVVVHLLHDFSMVGCIMVMFMQWTWRIVVMSCRTCVNILVLNSHHRKTRGMGAGRKLKTHRRNQRWADKAYKKSHLGNEWKKPFAGSSHAKGIVLEKMYVSHGNDLCFYYLVLYVLGLRCVASIV